MLNVSDLDRKAILWLHYLAEIDRPCGLIHNNTDKIIWLNNCEHLKIGQIAAEVHINKSKLIELKHAINKLEFLSVEDRLISHLKLIYLINTSGSIVEVTDLFYKVIIADQTFRVFEQIEEKII